ncbi:MAG: uncharacterized protein KVP18_005157, partial [Porospora cf. gigantea A]|uniref:uncharacterized protein n=1 Tax=Porospora cf. gigantea A TaxID=2853593 RepID=UPI0035595DBD
MSIFDYNGSCVVAMAGENCVAIASDTRLGSNQLQTVTGSFPKCFRMGSKSFVGLTGLATDIQTVHETLKFKKNLFELRQEREMSPHALASQISSLLYGRRFGPYFVGPVVAGLNESNEPYLAAFDLLGAGCMAKDFVVNGTTSEQLYG